MLFGNERAALSAWVGYLRDPVTAKILAKYFDCIVVDHQHGSVEVSDIHRYVTFAREGADDPDYPVLVRTVSHDYATIGRILDAGASGIIAAMVNTAEQAKAIIDAILYPPHGNRSMGGGFHSINEKRQPHDINMSIVFMPMIETPEGVKNADEILRITGVTGLMIGATDLKTTMGVEFGSEEHEQAITNVRKACYNAGNKPCGFPAHDPLEAAKRIEQEFMFIEAAGDISLIEQAATNRIADIAQYRS